MSGPIISVSEPTMNALRRVENIELAIEGRDNRWSGIRA
jgi:BioD-like phosphotransacetylase family protein